jgi:hypothetical protein
MAHILAPVYQRKSKKVRPYSNLHAIIVLCHVYVMHVPGECLHYCIAEYLLVVAARTSALEHFTTAERPAVTDADNYMQSAAHPAQGYLGSLFECMEHG